MLRYSQFSLYNTSTEQQELGIIKGFYCREAGHSSLFPAAALLLNCPVVAGNEFCLDPPTLHDKSGVPVLLWPQLIVQRCCHHLRASHVV